MISCRATRRQLLDIVRQTASDAARLRVESHLENCEDCRIERTRWDLIGFLKSQPTPRLNTAAERRIIAHLVQLPTTHLLKRNVAPRVRVRTLAAAFALAVAGAGVFVFSSRYAGVRSGASTLVEGQRIEDSKSGAVSFGGARVAYDAGTTMVVHPERRRLELLSGKIEVDVTEGLPGRFRVAASRFVVEVLGTRFVVTPTSVHTLRGHVRVLDLEGREMVALHAGQIWVAPNGAVTGTAPLLPSSSAAAASLDREGPDRAPATSPAPPTVVESAAPPAPQALAPTSLLPLSRGRVVPAASISIPAEQKRQDSRHASPVNDLLSLTRAALADGDAPRGRKWIERARSGYLNESQAAAVDLLEADAWLVGRQPEKAISTYRGVFLRRPEAPEGEIAAFAVGQLLAESGAAADAIAAFNDYLVRYPQGRFVSETRDRLEQLRSAE